MSDQDVVRTFRNVKIIELPPDKQQQVLWQEIISSATTYYFEIELVLDGAPKYSPEISEAGLASNAS